MFQGVKKIKLDVFGEDFHNYSQVVDTIEEKICNFFSLPYPLVPFPPNSVLQQSQSLLSSPPTPPYSSKKKKISDKMRG